MSDLREVPSYSISRESEPREAGGFLGAIDKVAGALLPFLDVARSFKAGYQGLPLPGRTREDSRMAGDRLIFQVYQDMLARNEREAERAREERKLASDEDLRRQLILKGVEKGDISLDKALKALKSGEFDFSAPPGPTAPASPAASPAP